jgi:hypothetical protein
MVRSTVVCKLCFNAAFCAANFLHGIHMNSAHYMHVGYMYVAFSLQTWVFYLNQNINRCGYKGISLLIQIVIINTLRNQHASN